MTPEEARGRSRVRFDPGTLTYSLESRNGCETYATCGSCAVERGRDAIRLIHLGRADEAGRCARSAARWALRWLAGDYSYWSRSR